MVHTDYSVLPRARHQVVLPGCCLMETSEETVRRLCDPSHSNQPMTTGTVAHTSDLSSLGD
jgi:hypothetical protein